jgi:Protein of unknown function (DUF3761)
MAMNMRTKRLRIGGVVAGGLMLGAAGLVIAAGVAKADGSRGDHNAYAYAAELRTDGMSGTADSAENLAAQVCLARTNGHTEQEAISYAETMPMPTKMAVDVVMGAEWHFCPAYDSLHMGDYGGPPSVTPPPPMKPLLPNAVSVTAGYAERGGGRGGSGGSSGGHGGGCYTAKSVDCVERPTRAPSRPPGATAQCVDGAWSFSEHPDSGGTCHGHGGVSR